MATFTNPNVDPDRIARKVFLATVLYVVAFMIAVGALYIGSRGSDRITGPSELPSLLKP